MPSDRIGDRDDLLDGLEAFGATLARIVDEPIQPSTSPPQTSASAEPSSGWSRRVVWLAVAALLLVGGFGLGRMWPTGPRSIDSTGPTSDGTEPPGDHDGSGERGLGRDTNPPAMTSTTSARLAPVPSTITAADGTVLSVIDDIDALSSLGSIVDQGDVVARMVLAELVRLQLFGEDREEVARRLVSGGLTIVTTYDPSVQALAAATIAEVYPEGDRPDEVALVTIDNRTGAIVALASSGVATHVLSEGRRPPGSAFKPVVLATLFEQGYHPDDLVSADGPCSFAIDDDEGGRRTVGGSSRGIGTIRSATLSSNNCAFARLGQAAGPDQVVAMAQDLGIASVLDDAGADPSLPLGVEGVNGIQLAGAYASFANGGMHRTPWLVSEIIDRDGTSLHQRPPESTDGRPVISERSASLITDVLEANIDAGTGRNAQLSRGHWAAGKTGTTELASDAWFVGYTRYYTTLVWLGSPDSMEQLRIPGWSSFGGGLPATVWGRYNDELHRDLEPLPFPEPPALEGREPVILEAESELPAE